MTFHISNLFWAHPEKLSTIRGIMTQWLMIRLQWCSYKSYYDYIEWSKEELKFSVQKFFEHKDVKNLFIIKFVENEKTGKWKQTNIDMQKEWERTINRAVELHNQRNSQKVVIV